MRLQITQPADWVEAFKVQAEKDGLSLSAWIGEKCKAGLPKQAQSKLTERQGVGPIAQKKISELA